MSELRAPDPTLGALPRGFIVEFVTADLHGEPAEAHCIDSQHTSGPMIPAADARWFAVPCRECVPGAPDPGTRAECPDGDHHVSRCKGQPSPDLAWQVAP